MKRIFNDFAYGPGPREGCWWDETCSLPERAALEGCVSADVAIVGGGFTGLTAAFTLGQAGVRVALLDAYDIGWGASGRNGGFCCLGGSMASDAELDTRFGRNQRLAFRQTELDAVRYVEDFIKDHRFDVDRHSEGETLLAHRSKDVASLRVGAASVQENYGVVPTVLSQNALAENGMASDAFHGAMTIPIGFALNPRKYLAGLVRATEDQDVQLYARSAVHALEHKNGKYTLVTRQGKIVADQVVFATNGYSSENLPHWMAGRYMPAQSTVIVTRPLTDAEIAAQGWFTGQMCYDTRKLLHYFRLMPDRRFLFGMRGGLFTGVRAEKTARARVRAAFERMFPSWAHVESPFAWSGMVSLARDKLPFAGQIPHHEGVWAAMCYHGNGVAMGSYAGRMVAKTILCETVENCPSFMARPLERFPLGLARRSLMLPLYAAMKFKDWI